MQNHNNLMPALVLALGVCFNSSLAWSMPEKDKYNLFNPTPMEQMREMSTDRPDKTESPYTVDAGHYQLEFSFIDYTYDRHNTEGSETDVDNFSYVPLNLKIGLLNNTDLQLVFDSYLIEKTTEAGVKERKTGNGDFQTRLKINLWGNDQGDTALAVMPFVKFPVNSNNLGNDNVEGGIIIPLAIALPAQWNMGLMTEFDFNRSLADSNFYTDYINTVTFSRQIAGDLGGYIEFFSSFNEEPNSPWVGTVDGGLTYAVNENVQLDLGVNIGVTRSADDFNPFCGLSMRY